MCVHKYNENIYDITNNRQFVNICGIQLKKMKLKILNICLLYKSKMTINTEFMNLDPRKVPDDMLSEYDRLKWREHDLHFKEMRCGRSMDRSFLDMDINDFLRRLNNY